MTWIDIDSIDKTLTKAFKFWTSSNLSTFITNIFDI